MRDVTVIIKGQVEDDVSKDELENLILDEICVDVTSIEIKEVSK